jgi:secreted trypsin-like serine protease
MTKVNQKSTFKSLSMGVLASSAFLIFACGKNNKPMSEVKITGGERVDDNTPKYITQSVVAFAKNADFYNQLVNHRSSFCTGVILDESHILTAAHCADMREQTLVVFSTSMGSALLEAKTKTRQVVKSTKHPEYPDTYVEENGVKLRRNIFEDNPTTWLEQNAGKPPHDLAVIEFEGGLPEGYKPVKLAKAETALPSTATQAGFGISRSSNIGDTGVLRWISDNILHAQSEEDMVRKWIEVGLTSDAKKIGDGVETAKGACPGDSGGPAFIKGEKSGLVTGILSLGESEKVSPDANFTFCDAHKPGTQPLKANVYTDIRSYQEWIQEAVAK